MINKKLSNFFLSLDRCCGVCVVGLPVRAGLSISLPALDLPGKKESFFSHQWHELMGWPLAAIALTSLRSRACAPVLLQLNHGQS